MIQYLGNVYFLCFRGWMRLDEAIHTHPLSTTVSDSRVGFGDGRGKISCEFVAEVWMDDVISRRASTKTLTREASTSTSTPCKIYSEDPSLFFFIVTNANPSGIVQNTKPKSNYNYELPPSSLLAEDNILPSLLDGS
jgi:hypothetical protein